MVDAAQAITVHGDVEGEISGSYQVLNWPDRPADAFDPTDEPEVDESAMDEAAEMLESDSADSPADSSSEEAADAST